MKIGVVGSRRFSDYPLMRKALDKFGKCSMIISGGAKGADMLAQQYAQEHGLPILIRYPNYSKFGRKAPLVRNVLIAQDCATDESGIMFAFPFHDSNGSWHVINHARNYGVKIYVFETDANNEIKMYTIN